MRIIDANVLMYATNRDSPHHAAARGWLGTALTGSETIGLPWVSVLAFIRVGTNPRVFASPHSIDQAFGYVDSWLEARPAILLNPTSGHRSILRRLLQQAGTAGNLTTDAHIAALAIEYDAEIVTFDRDFARFGVRVLIPGPQ